MQCVRQKSCEQTEGSFLYCTAQEDWETVTRLLLSHTGSRYSSGYVSSIQSSRLCCWNEGYVMPAETSGLTPDQSR